mmetsp:Transcript_38801/g.116665  ORF Transcript_38801/g.116665 Transcript_38801/m.116665 type:complete len:296 (+) Transcript_38801:389-1276(+)
MTEMLHLEEALQPWLLLQRLKSSGSQRSEKTQKVRFLLVVGASQPWLQQLPGRRRLQRRKNRAIQQVGLLLWLQQLPVENRTQRIHLVMMEVLLLEGALQPWLLQQRLRNNIRKRSKQTQSVRLLLVVVALQPWLQQLLGRRRLVRRKMLALQQVGLQLWLQRLPVESWNQEVHGAMTEVLQLEEALQPWLLLQRLKSSSSQKSEKTKIVRFPLVVVVSQPWLQQLLGRRKLQRGKMRAFQQVGLRLWLQRLLAENGTQKVHLVTMAVLQLEGALRPWLLQQRLRNNSSKGSMKA